MRRQVVVCALAFCLLPFASMAGDRADAARTCTDRAAAPGARIAACTWLAASDQLEASQRAEALSFRGSVLADTGDYAAAIRDYEEAIRLEPRFGDACGSLASLLAEARLALERRSKSF
jgi:tetratricopeptide (TPR) repeat protein